LKSPTVYTKDGPLISLSDKLSESSVV